MPEKKRQIEGVPDLEFDGLVVHVDELAHEGRANLANSERVTVSKRWRAEEFSTYCGLAVRPEAVGDEPQHEAGLAHAGVA
eukprot:scaffold2505_cov152-Ochromonas_danica.AAC.4